LARITPGKAAIAALIGGAAATVVVLAANAAIYCLYAVGMDARALFLLARCAVSFGAICGALAYALRRRGL
jgi:hypothetical protein